MGKKQGKSEAVPSKDEEQKSILKNGAVSKDKSKSEKGSKKQAKGHEASSQSKDSTYESSTLSKKEKRKLKKQQEKAKMLADDSEGESESLEEEEDDEDDDEEEQAGANLDLERLEASDVDFSEDDSSDESSSEEGSGSGDDNEEDEEKEEEAEEDVPLSDVDIDSDADIVPHTKLTVNNTAALRDSLARIQLPWSKHSFQEHQTVTSAQNTDEGIKDIYDDTERELAFYKQALDAVKQGKKSLLKLKVPFSRPLDYFAEMVKSDEHMDQLKNKLLQEAADKKASEEAKRQRSLKKFGKQVQVNVLQDRAKQKREALEKIKSLKRKRGNNELSNDDDFQIALEEATKEESSDKKRKKPNTKRLAKNAKFGYGGKKRGQRANDANSSADVSDFSVRKMKNKSRPGKSKRSRRH
ncbi:Piso0_003993 [Millerozyma farinosa CBS 7064]|uniref:Piso0_003993 protein n=1 Tax=Pichia sorbitophila (strain ATCC MYA-4447 / BCRC 22081 / CBS 7064 / NBRC 10061 / NRRL Y-12695) TaxID=559304 RepID=G8Y769_PICSO|nr:Piso0_003993 [Millerozyma farinosa CBS 7064]CCE84449.1 Piso0_003993 [Millerozyma farinosa CBS 7064]